MTRPDPSANRTTTGHRHPQTSLFAAARAEPKSGTKRALVLGLLKRRPDGLTDGEIQSILRMPPNTERPRRVELVRDGWIEDSGQTRLNVFGNPETVWRYIDYPGQS